MPLYVVINRRGDNYKKGLPLEQQPEWEAHAAFMDALGFTFLWKELKK